MAESELIEGLARWDAYPFPVERVDIIETHISWVILTGTFAYKIKKPVNFGFLDFSSLEARQYYCEEELKLNRRLAGDLYLASVPITGTPSHPHMEGTGAAFEYAVKMRQFDNTNLFDSRAEAGQLSNEMIERLADRLAAFHLSLPGADPGDAYGTPETVYLPVSKNFETLQETGLEAEDSARLNRLALWTEQQYQKLYPYLLARKQDGFIRECHGDLHLGNIVLIGDEPIPFDAIEFNPTFRWIDLMSELAFLVMDLEVRGLGSAGVRCLNRYLAATGDYAGLQVFDFYRLYRALVRAKITQLSRNPATETPERRDKYLARYRAYIDYGLELITTRKPRLLLTHGFSGSGKSRLASQLAERTHAIVLRSDVERKRLHTGSDGDLYGKAFTEKTYRHLLDLTRLLLEAGFTVVVDATFLDREHRAMQQQLAGELKIEWFIFSCTAPRAVLQHRIEQRALEGADPSDATVTVLERQIAHYQPLAEDELNHRVEIDCSTPESLEYSLENWLKYGQPHRKSAN